MLIKRATGLLETACGRALLLGISLTSVKIGVIITSVGLYAICLVVFEFIDSILKSIARQVPSWA